MMVILDTLQNMKQNIRIGPILNIKNMLLGDEQLYAISSIVDSEGNKVIDMPLHISLFDDNIRIYHTEKINEDTSGFYFYAIRVTFGFLDKNGNETAWDNPDETGGEVLMTGTAFGHDDGIRHLNIAGNEKTSTIIN